MSVDLTLAAIVDANPSAARVLELHQLDYCCGGRRTLEEACADRDLDPAVVLDALETAEPGGTAEWTAMDPAALVDHIEATHHRYLHDELPRLTALVEKVVGVHGTRHPELRLVEATYTALRLDLEPHLMKEERVLFPMVRELAAAASAPSFHCGSVANPIQMMMFEHDHAGDLLAHLRTVANGYEPPADACASYQALYRGLAELEADTHLHVHKENNVLFPAVLALEADLSAR
ncbi:MAG: iron-sulfur cluster repair di-iron protein [Thermoanaerobaculia bacterium]